MIMDSFASLALATESPKEDILDRPPFPKKAAILTRKMWRFILGHAVYQFIVLIIFIFFAAGEAPKARPAQNRVWSVQRVLLNTNGQHR